MCERVMKQIQDTPFASVKRYCRASVDEVNEMSVLDV